MHHTVRRRHVALRTTTAAAVVAALAVSACGAGDDGAADPEVPVAVATAETAVEGVQVVSPRHAADTIAAAPEGLVILDVRTEDEFDEGRIEGAVMLDFYRDDFADQLAELDRDVPYVLYCRSGNRSGQTRSLMRDLGFDSVADIDGGVIGWQRAGLPLVRE